MTAPPDFDLGGRRALVTGGGVGLGKEMAGALLDAGARVVICGRRGDVLERAASELAAQGPVEALPVDVTDASQVDRLRDSLDDVDILVNNAGLARRGSWADESIEAWRSIMTLNVDAPFMLCQRFVPRMVERGWGRVVNVSSIYGLVAPDPARNPGLSTDMASYVTSKHALIGLTRFLAAQLGATGVTVNALCPGMFVSPSVEDQISPELDHALGQGAPLRRRGGDRELRSALLYLTAPGSSFVTGQAVVVDGGWTIW